MVRRRDRVRQRGRLRGWWCGRVVVRGRRPQARLGPKLGTAFHAMDVRVAGPLHRSQPRAGVSLEHGCSPSSVAAASRSHGLELGGGEAVHVRLMRLAALVSSRGLAHSSAGPFFFTRAGGVKGQFIPSGDVLSYRPRVWCLPGRRLRSDPSLWVFSGSDWLPPTILWWAATATRGSGRGLNVLRRFLAKRGFPERASSARPAGRRLGRRWKRWGRGRDTLCPLPDVLRLDDAEEMVKIEALHAVTFPGTQQMFDFPLGYGTIEDLD